jgi:hypothetical protein
VINVWNTYNLQINSSTWVWCSAGWVAAGSKQGDHYANRKIRLRIEWYVMHMPASHMETCRLHTYRKEITYQKQNTQQWKKEERDYDFVLVFWFGWRGSNVPFFNTFISISRFSFFLHKKKHIIKKWSFILISK